MPDRHLFEGTEDKDPVFDWWDAADLRPMFECIAQHGTQNVRVENHYYGQGEARAVEIRVVDKATGDLLGSFNMSHPCPPNCP